MRIPLATASSVLFVTSLAAQTTVHVDFGDSGLPAATTGWNDVDPSSLAAGLDLVDGAGAATGWRLEVDPAAPLRGSVTAGTTTPGGALGSLGWPAEVVRDAMWNDSGTPEAIYTISGLDPTASYELVLSASRTGVSDVRTGLYTVSGFTSASGVLDAANNTDDVLVFADLVPSLTQTITLHLRADGTNTNPNGYYYLGGLELRETPGGASGSLLAFASPLAFRRKQGKGAFTTTTSVLAYDGSTPGVALSAIDDATGLAPTWLTLPSSATAGTPFSVTVDEAVLAVGSYAATVTGQAAGYPDAVGQVTFTVRDANGSRNLLFYGNSYSMGHGTVPGIVEDLADTAGLPDPNVTARLVGGQNLFYHLTNPTQAAAITTALPLGEEWDFVVMQGFSTEATSIGDPAAFLANAQAIFANVRAHSPSAQACFYQTWARARGHSFYPGSFAGPLQMHREIEDSYTQAEALLNANFGAGSARRAAVGETVALLDFAPFLYDPDLSHPEAPLSLLAGLCLFQELYRVPVCSLQPDFGGTSPLANWLTSYSVDSAQWSRLVGLASRVAADVARPYPGSGDDLFLRSGPAGGLLTGCPELAVTGGDLVNLSLQSPNETFVGANAFLYLQRRPSGGALAPHPVLSGLYLDPTQAMTLLSLGTLASGQQSAGFTVPAVLSGARFLVQGYAAATSYQTGLGFTTTDAHVLELAPGAVQLVPLAPLAPPAPGSR